MKKTKKQTAKKGRPASSAARPCAPRSGDFKFTITPRWAVTIADSELHTARDVETMRAPLSGLPR